MNPFDLLSRFARLSVPVLVCILSSSGCALPGAGPGNSGSIATSPVLDGIQSGIEAEKRRVERFPDLPDAGDPGPSSSLDGSEPPASSADRGSGQSVEDDRDASPGVVTDRAREERRDAFNPYVLTAHRQNFVLPVAYTTGLNESVYENNEVPFSEGLRPVEVKFQISLKAQMNDRDLLLKDDSLIVALTIESWWQLYSSDLSSPFRETNYQPEIFYLKPLLWGPFGGSTAWLFGLEHQSNGKVQGLSRSWNRLYTGLIYERGNFVARIRPWYRIPEKSKSDPSKPEGDDNPDILDFMGYGDLAFYLRHGASEYGLLTRGNPSTGKGALNVRWTFPLFGKFRGMVDYLNGYGDSLIDYDYFQQRLGVGVALTSLL